MFYSSYKVFLMSTTGMPYGSAPPKKSCNLHQLTQHCWIKERSKPIMLLNSCYIAAENI